MHVYVNLHITPTHELGEVASSQVYTRSCGVLSGWRAASFTMAQQQMQTQQETGIPTMKMMFKASITTSAAMGPACVENNMFKC